MPAASLLLLLLGAHYLSWRLGSTLNLALPWAAAFSLTVLAAELLLLASFFLQLALSLWPPPRPATGSSAACPTVDVLVPSYGEPPALIERCLRGCLAMAYPRQTVWLLDDSGRPELAALCERLGVRHLHRRERNHAKAGNLNHALGHCSGELIAVFDADVVPLQSFLNDTVPLFADPALGFVQTPQSSMNADPVMRNLRLERWLMPDEECFYRWIEPCREAVGAVVCAGTSFVMRREALDRVGGFETGTPSEDLATGIRITALGYRNRYLARKLSAGLAPFTATAMARQRCRWASGTLQVLRTGANPLTIPGLNPLQRLAYLEGILHWFNVLPQLLLVLLPLGLALFGVAPILVSGEGLLRHAMPFYGAQLLLARWINRHSSTALLPELYRWIHLLPLAGAVLLTLLGRPQRFRVTPKQQDSASTGHRPSKRLLLPLVLLLALQGISALGLLAPPAALNPQPLSGATAVMAWGWIGANCLLLAVAIRACWPRSGLAAEPWFALRVPCHLGWPHSDGGWHQQPLELVAISEAGVELRGPAQHLPADLGRDGQLLQLQLPGLPALPLVLRARRQRGRGGAATLQLGGLWQPLSAEQREHLQRYLYQRPRLWPERRAPLEPLALLVLLGRLVNPGPAEGWFARSLIAQAAPPTGDPGDPPPGSPAPAGPAGGERRW